MLGVFVNKVKWMDGRMDGRMDNEGGGMMYDTHTILFYY